MKLSALKVLERIGAFVLLALWVTGCATGNGSSITRDKTLEGKTIVIIDVWINNAGVCASGRFDEIPAKDHAQINDGLMGNGRWMLIEG